MNASSDIRAGDWVDRFLPEGARPYARLARLDRPIGTWLLLLPCWWGTALAPGGDARWDLFLLFAIGALVMRGAGCVINDFWDRDIDAKVARTADRPLASGRIGLPAAFAFLAALLLIGLAVLLQLDRAAIVTGFAVMGVVVIYPLAKRVTFWPQLVLGVAFNWGALVGWAAIRGTIEAPAILLYAAGILWTLGYDTIYAHQDKADDAKIGVKSTALLLGRATRRWLVVFYAGATALLIAAGIAAGAAWPFYAALAAAALHFLSQAKTLDLDDPKDCLAKFKSNRDAGLAITIACLIA
ncbi:MAG: 4-hydroxybenzoate octaprenyltransferase [Alphaproteobacteria bacterium]|nr:4-hydroxybenzoate octaprenyltransferase [Alphaproteobacteria bacterium]